jgi:hypothetical protein
MSGVIACSAPSHTVYLVEGGCSLVGHGIKCNHQLWRLDIHLPGQAAVAHEMLQPGVLVCALLCCTLIVLALQLDVLTRA